MPSALSRTIAAAALLLGAALCAFTPTTRADGEEPPPTVDVAHPSAEVELPPGDLALPPAILGPPPVDGLPAPSGDEPPPPDSEDAAPPPDALAPSPEGIAPPAGGDLAPSTNQPPPAPGFLEDKGAARALYVAESKGIDVDSDSIRKDQQRILRKMNSHARDALYSGINHFTQTLDLWHDNAFLLLDNLIRTLDIRLGRPDSEYKHEISSCVLSLSGRAGGRGNDDDFEGKVRFGASIALPGLEERFHLVADNLGRDDLPGTDPMVRESDVRVGVRSSWKSFFGNRWDLGGGVRIHDMAPVGYVDLTWDWSADWAGGTLNFDPSGVWYTDDGFGENASFSWTSDRTRHTIWQLITAESVRERDSGVHLEETLRVGFPHHAKGCGWIVQASLFPHVKDEGHTFFDDIVLNVTWRDALYRRWMYYSITPQCDFAAEDGHDPKPSLRIGIVILFGRETGELL